MHRNVSFHTSDTESTWNGRSAVRGFGPFTSVEELQRPRIAINFGPLSSTAVTSFVQYNLPNMSNNPYV